MKNLPVSHIQLMCENTCMFSYLERTTWSAHLRHALLERQAISHAQHRCQIRTEGYLDWCQRRPDISTNWWGANQLPCPGHFRDLCQQTHHWPRPLLCVRAASIQMLTHKQNGWKLQDLQWLWAGGPAGIRPVSWSCVWCHLEVRQRIDFCE